MTVIHFMDLEDMIPELSTNDIVRMNTQIKYIPTVSGRPGVSLSEVGVYVRQNVLYDTYSWMIPVGQYEMYEGKPFTMADEDIRIKAEEESKRIEDLITERLLAHAEFDIRPGIIDLGISTDHAGYWSLLDMEHVAIEDVINEIDGEPGLENLEF